MALHICILTLNCWGIPYISKDREKRMNAIAEELKSGKYQIVTLQELWSQSDFELIKQKTAKVLPYAHYFYSGVAGSGVCILSVFRIIDTFFHAWSINGYIHRIQHGDWFGGKGVGLCKVRTDHGLVINIYTAHLHAEYNRVCDDYKAHRVLQAFEMGKFVSFTSSDADVTILGGDLNTEPNDLAYRIILGASGLKDSFIEPPTDQQKPRSTGTNEHVENTYTPKTVAMQCPEGKRIDYVLYKGSRRLMVDVSNYEHPLPDTIPGGNMSYSDHEAVVATLRVRNYIPSTSTKGFTTDVECSDCNTCTVKDPSHIQNGSPVQQTFVEDLKESINICNEAISSLDNHRRSYILLSIMCFVLLLAVIKMSDLPSLSFTSGVVLALQMTLTLVWMFGLLMATLWNNIERNSIYAGTLAMEIYLNSL